MPVPLRPTRRAAGGALLCGALAVGIIAGSSLAASAAPFLPDPEQITPGQRLTLSETHAVFPRDVQSLSPGDPGFWMIRAEQDDPAGAATLAVQLTTTGPLAEHPSGLRVTIEQCLEPWTGFDADDPACDAPGGSLTVTPAQDASQRQTDPVFMLDLDSTRPHYFLVTATVEDSPAARADESLMGLGGGIAVGVTAARGGDGVRPTGPASPSVPGPFPATGGLAATGGDLGTALALAMLAAAAVATGTGLRLLRPRREARA